MQQGGCGSRKRAKCRDRWSETRAIQELDEEGTKDTWAGMRQKGGQLKTEETGLRRQS